MLNDKECYCCGRKSNLHKHHVFYGNANRKKSDKYGLMVWLCLDHHNGKDGVHKYPNRGLDLELKRMGQDFFECNYGDRQDFIKEFGRNYL